jgi:hypothetical protein
MLLAVTRLFVKTSVSLEPGPRLVVEDVRVPHCIFRVFVFVPDIVPEPFSKPERNEDPSKTPEFA